MPFLFDVACEEAGDGVVQAGLAGKHVVQVGRDGHADAVCLCKGIGVVGSTFAFDSLADGGFGVCCTLSASEGEAEATVARLVIRAGENEVTHAGKAHQGFFMRTEGGRQAGDFAQAARNEGSTGVRTAAEAVSDTGCDGDDVFHGTANLDADKVVTGVAKEVAAVVVVGDVFCEGVIGSGNGHSGRLSGGDFFGEAGAGQDGVWVIGADGVMENVAE